MTEPVYGVCGMDDLPHALKEACIGWVQIDVKRSLAEEIGTAREAAAAAEARATTAEGERAGLIAIGERLRQTALDAEGERDALRAEMENATTRAWAEGGEEARQERDKADARSAVLERESEARRLALAAAESALVEARGREKALLDVVLKYTAEHNRIHAASLGPEYSTAECLCDLCNAADNAALPYSTEGRPLKELQGAVAPGLKSEEGK